MFITTIVTKIIGSSNQRTVRRLAKIVKSINALEPKFKELKDEDFKELTVKFRERLEKGETLEHILLSMYSLWVVSF